MRLHIIARGRIGHSPEADLVSRYTKRITWPFQLTELPETGGKLPAPPTPIRNVVLDERAPPLSSEGFAAILNGWRDGGVREARFWIGAADGHEDSFRNSADLLLGFGVMTWPHMLARAMLAEQLWRATSIIAGHPYHRSG